MIELFVLLQSIAEEIGLELNNVIYLLNLEQTPFLLHIYLNTLESQ